MKPFSILFVCSGNTCRSPLAERILKKRIRERGWRGVRVSSAGTAAATGAQASEGARKAARRRGIPMAGFKAKPVTAARVARADLILTMTRGHSNEIARRWPDARGKAHMIADYTGSGREAIIDPIGGTDGDYAQCADDLSDEIARLLPRLAHALGEDRREP